MEHCDVKSCNIIIVLWSHLTWILAHSFRIVESLINLLGTDNFDNLYYLGVKKVFTITGILIEYGFNNAFKNILIKKNVRSKRLHDNYRNSTYGERITNYREETQFRLL